MEFNILKLVKDALLSIGKKQGITDEKDIEILQEKLEELLPSADIDTINDQNNTDKSIKESDDNSDAPERIIYYETDAEFDKLINNISNNTTYIQVLWVDESIAYFIASVVELNDISNFYEFEKCYKSYKNGRQYILKIENYQQRIMQGFELYVEKFHDVFKDKYLKKETCISIIENINHEIDMTPYLLSTLQNFKLYWNDVLCSYKRKHYYNNRLIYIVDYTESLLSKDYIATNQAIKQQIMDLRNEYILMSEASTPNKNELLEGTIIQMLESVEIILSTVNIDIFFERYQFMKNISLELHNESKKPFYKQHVCRAIDKYTVRYNNKTISEAKLSFVYTPMQVMLDNIFGLYLHKFFMRYCDKMESKISSLKTEKAKERYLNRIAEASKLTIPYITNEELVGYAKMIFTMINHRLGIEYNISVKTEYSEPITK